MYTKYFRFLYCTDFDVVQFVQLLTDRVLFKALRTGRTVETYDEARQLSAKQRAAIPSRKYPSNDNIYSHGYGQTYSIPILIIFFSQSAYVFCLYTAFSLFLVCCIDKISLQCLTWSWS